MALFSDNDRDKVNEDIDLDDVDEVDDDTADQDNDQDQDDSTKNDSQPPKKETKKTDEPAEEETVEYWKKKAEENKTKFSESTRENQLERERRLEAERKLEEATKPKEITDDVMKAQYPDWDSYDEAVKTTLKKAAKHDQEIEQLKKGQSEYHNEQRWNNQVNSFLDENDETNKYPIKDREAFRKFVNKPERKGMNLDVLAAAFGFEVGSSSTTELPKPKSKKSLLEDGSGAGGSNKHTTDKKEYTAEDAKRLRENNPREYERMVRSGELNIKV